ncbi:hypothetical protein [Agrococcus casei]|uniref:hypothetical protein n=1 Tax=Agrococcus casei TaxID=343512 RepID=UPI003F8DA031
MNSTMLTKRLLSLGASCALLASSAVMPVTSTAPEELEGEGSDSVIYVDRPAPFPIFDQPEAGPYGTLEEASSTDGTDGWVYSNYDDAEFEPAIGESLTVHYTNATTIYSTPAFACTESISVGYPYKSNSNARVQLNVSRSSGCTGTKTAYGSLRVLVFLYYDYRNQDQIHVSPGQSWGSNLLAPCANSNSTNWMGTMGWNSADGDGDNERIRSIACGG